MAVEHVERDVAALQEEARRAGVPPAGCASDRLVRQNPKFRPASTRRVPVTAVGSRKYRDVIVPL